MADALNAEEESLLQSALQTAFTPVPLPKQSAAPEQPASAPEPAQEESGPTPAPAVPEHESTEEVWKAEYDAHVAEWRRASAEQREQAERERTRWEEIRKKEREEGKARGSARSDGWESVGGSTSASMVLDTTASTSTAASVGGEAGGEPSVADARDLVSGEGQGRKTKEELEQAILPGSHAQARSRFSTPPDAPEVEHKWEDIHSSDPDSLASSYPSLSFPSDPHSPSSSLPHPLPPHAHGHAHHHAHPHHAHEPSHEHTREAPSTTQALFDTSLSPRTRVLALVASLAVNIGLPFINGVMLGFGEIFAKEVLVVWLGWGKRSSSSTQAQERARPGAREGGAGLRTAERR
ncbi:uncharacterized protein B0H18DRAFT_1117844 [Fomitopsis serialis]|uniref:uncharacterized protein n=1 Tax=Fomitopsis serialis TaxID=139415 RepID=UPI0020078C9E|nr:uncharacterized protein B0H18DRAFT_1117844 [Neoantrodia serialis]KAH9928651.1 hypothetical protein B0H18DRAFT_1117844 [Neoantrodia serialis]